MAAILQSNPERPYSLLFSSVDRYDVVKWHADPLVVTTLVSSFKIRRMLVNTSNSVDILFWDAFQRMRISKDRLCPVGKSLVELVEHRVTPLGTIHLTLTLGEEPRCARLDANWLVVDCEMSHIATIGPPSLTEVRATISSISYI